jgi:phage terminase large subunit
LSSSAPPSPRLELPEAFEPLFQPARYKAFWGGRGSGKSHSFAAALVTKAYEESKRILCAREIQKSIRDSVKALIDDKIAEGRFGGFKSTETYIEHTGTGSVFLFAGLREQNVASIKSLEGIDIAWVEEASSLSKRSLQLLTPTIRKEGSEIWFSWNPDQEHDPVDRMFRGPSPPPNSIIRKVSWRDNPWFTSALRGELEHDQASDPGKYEHVWEGGYAQAQDGAYYTRQLAQARAEGRTSRRLVVDPNLPVRAFWDLGVSDHTAIWIAQFVDMEIRFLDYIEAQGQPLGYYLNELRGRGHGQAVCVLPHDAAQRDLNTAKSLEQHVKDGGFRAEIVTNQGKGAAMARVEAARRLFPRMWFDSENTDAGLKALAAYHERRDENRNVGLGPEHDWASHGADAFGLACVAYREPTKAKPIVYPKKTGIV